MYLISKEKLQIILWFLLLIKLFSNQNCIVDGISETNEQSEIDSKVAENSFQAGIDDLYYFTIIQAPLEFEKLNFLTLFLLDVELMNSGGGEEKGLGARQIEGSYFK